MKLIDLTCTKCGAQLQVNPELKKCICQYCGNEMLIDDETVHHKIDNGFQLGYEAEIGRQKAQAELELKEKHKQRMLQKKKEQRDCIMILIIISIIIAFFAGIGTEHMILSFCAVFIGIPTLIIMHIWK